MSRKEVIKVKCVSTEKELLECGAILSSKNQEKLTAECDLKDFSAQKRAEIVSCEKIMQIQSQKINNGFEYRDLTCDLIKNYNTRQREYWYGGKIVHTDILTEKDLQEELDLGIKDIPVTEESQRNFLQLEHVQEPTADDKIDEAIVVPDDDIETEQKLSKCDYCSNPVVTETENLVPVEACRKPGLKLHACDCCYNKITKNF